MSKNLNEFTIIEAARALRAREVTVRELYDYCYAEAVSRNLELNAYLEFFHDAETDAAIEAAQKRIDADGAKKSADKNGEEGGAPLLCGIPLAIKDNILIEGRLVSAASKMLENYKATYDATVIKKLKAQNAIFIGRTNMDEFALGGSTENSAFGVTKNPYDTSRVSGGTSGGSAAAVAAHGAIAALGSDTGGSVRNPASYCGVVGFKPTYGGVSRSGLIAAASSFDQIGPLTKTVSDAKILFDAIKGNDPLDSTTIPAVFSYQIKETPKKFRIGVPRHLLEKGLDAEVLKNFEATLESLKKEGHTIVDIELPTSSYAIAAYYIINFAEVSTNLSRLDGIRYGLAERGATLLDDYVDSRTEGFGPETIRRILLGTFVLSAGYIDAYYRKALAARGQLASEFNNAFKDVDVVATPTMPTPAFVIGEKSDPVSMYLEDIFTVTANLTGMPAISVPMGAVQRPGNDGTDKSLPTGIHFTAPKGAEDFLFTIGAAVTGENI